MLDYLHALGMVLLVLGVASIAIMPLGFYASLRIQSRIGRIVIVWPLFALLALVGITLLLGIHVYAIVYGVIRMAF